MRPKSTAASSSPASPRPATERSARLSELRRLERASRALEPGVGERRRWRAAAVACGERFLSGLAGGKAFERVPEPGRGLLRVPIGETGMALGEALEVFESEVVRPGAHPGAAGHLAFIPGGGIYPAALADYLAAVTNKYAGLFYTGPGAVRMENRMVRWAANLVGYPAGAGGHLASGGSLATLAAVATARDARALGSGRGAVVYRTAQAHHCLEKALWLAGLTEVALRTIPVDGRFRLRPDALAEAIAADRRQGLEPWLVSATAGTTDTGAVDPLEAIGEIARREGCWFHVDAAYGGFFLLTEQGRRLLAGIEQSDSVVLDPHKGLFLPFGTGLLLVRDAEPLLRTHRMAGAYLQEALGERPDDPDEISPAELSPELSRPFRALRLWLPLVVLGTTPFRAALEEKLLLARHFHHEIEAAGFEVGPPPELSIVTFRDAPPHLGLAEQNRHNEAIAEALRRDGRVFLSTTTLDGKVMLRMAALSFRTHRKTVDLTLRILRSVRARLR